MMAKSLPVPNSDTHLFWEGCRRHELTFQKCGECGMIRWPPSIACPGCHATRASWTVVSGRGRVYSFVIYHQAFHPAFEGDVPYVVATIELAEGPRFLTSLVGFSRDRIAVGMEVEVRWEDLDAGISLPRFGPVAS